MNNLKETSLELLIGKTKYTTLAEAMEVNGVRKILLLATQICNGVSPYVATNFIVKDYIANKQYNFNGNELEQAIAQYNLIIN